jgi:hypothetical protein
MSASEYGVCPLKKIKKKLQLNGEHDHQPLDFGILPMSTLFRNIRSSMIKAHGN